MIRTTTIRSGACLLLGFLCGLSILAAQENPADSDEPPAVAWPIHYDHLDRGVAQEIVLEICAGEPDCQLRAASGGPHGGKVEVSATPAIRARIQSELARRDNVGSTHRFQIAVVEASREGGVALDGLSEPARTALDDVVSLLPFEGLALRDVALITTSRSASTQVSGPQGAQYDLRFEMQPVVRREGLVLVVHRFLLVGLLETSFELAAGETTVVGTSRLNGGESALIVLVTALTDAAEDEPGAEPGSSN